MPIVMGKDEWERIVKWTDQDKEDPDVIRRREYVRYLDATSKEMTKTWPNSVENVNKRNDELRRERIEAAEQANAKFYKRYVTRQKEQQQRLMHNARDIIFKNKDAPKLMLSAVIETVIQKERMEQLKFIEEQKRWAAEQKRLDDDEIIKKAKEWHELMAIRKKSRFDTNKQHQKEILDQAHEVAERNRNEYEAELNLQKIDNIKANEQMEAIKEFDDNFKAAEKARIWSDMERSRQEVEARRKEQAARDRLDDQLLEVLLNSRSRVERKRAQTELQVKNEKLRVLEKISQKLESGDAAREAKDQAILNKAVREKEDAEEARRQAQLRKENQFRQDRMKAREQFLRDEEQRLHEFNTMHQWEIMNRFKNAELYEDFKEKLRVEKERKIQEYRDDILKLWKERDDRSALERAATRHFYGACASRRLRAADAALLARARLLVAEARARGRPDFALRKAVDRYCKMYRLYPMPELPASMQEHLGRHAPGPEPGPESGPEPGPAPPHAPDDKRDGLHDPFKAGSSKPSNAKKEESVEDYRRVGKADGLQRIPKQHDLSLPPIAVVPRRTDASRCQLKP